jgi:ABC-type Fe3+-hydroxamate transport system substrate-binding protein
MKAFAMVVGFIAISAVGGLGQGSVSSAAELKPDGVTRWEYRVLTKDQVLDLGKKDFTVGLNKLGAEGWELIAFEGGYIFKRPKDQDRKQVEEIKQQIALAESDLEAWKDRVTWVERMVKKGYMTERQLQNERAQLTRVEMALDWARKALKNLSADPKEPDEKERQPQK